ncbi:RNA-binding domain superfamily [Sesbania bispinosa]|nr:RNA-binding domain superfamily [Sesbania bispinosa]
MCGRHSSHSSAPQPRRTVPLICTGTRTVQVKQVSDLASEREIQQFFSFSGEIEHIEIQSCNVNSGLMLGKEGKV